MVQFAGVFPDERIVSAMRTQLGWSHFKEIIPQEDELERDFNTEMRRKERWSVRTLRKKIGGMLYERTALSKKPDKLIRQGLAARGRRVGAGAIGGEVARESFTHEKNTTVSTKANG